MAFITVEALGNKREINILITPGLISVRCLAIQFPQKSIHCRTTLPSCSRQNMTVLSLGEHHRKCLPAMICVIRPSSCRQTLTSERKRGSGTRKEHIVRWKRATSQSYLHVHEPPPSPMLTDVV